MSILKCKMCGGDLLIQPGKTFGTCEYCGCTMTLPKIDDEQRAAAFNRGNHFRRIGEFDKALAVYEHIVQETPADAEAHWCCALCRFGIEYVEDPSTYEYIPTCHRASFDSFLEDVDYLAALENSEGITRRQYQKDAAKIEEVRRGILTTSQSEEPFDIFICYKETDENGQRTKDSLMAQEIYYQLTDQGRRVFFARITLEDKVGSQYEPYIFAALNSAKVMICVGTKPEHFNAVWVKNEWSRFLALMKRDRSKLLLPCYRDMDPYDLPEQLAVLQSYDMAKIGFIQDLTRGISKVLAPNVQEKPTQTAPAEVKAAAVNTEPILKRAFMFLEDGEWERADDFCEQVLNQDPENAQAYLGKLMVEMHARKQASLRDCEKPFDGSNNYQKTIRFAEPALAEELKACNAYIRERNENVRLTDIYNKAVKAMQEATTEEACKAAAGAFATIPGFKDADALAQQSLEKAEVCRKDAVYASAAAKMAGEKVGGYESAIEIFRTIPGWKDAEEQIFACEKKIEEIRAKEETQRIAKEKAAKKRKKIIAIAAPVVCACIAFAVAWKTVIVPMMEYNAASKQLSEGKIVEAYEGFVALEGYKDSAEKADEIFNQYRIKLANVGETVLFGRYEQDNNASNGKEDVEWIVLAKEEGKILVISKYALDCQKYNSSRAAITWGKSSLRAWMNGTFLNDAFSAEEQAQIQNTTVSADKNPKYDTNPGNATTDKVFLLSITEVEKYFSSDNARQCKPTKYAVVNGAYVNSDNHNCWWWLRSPGYYQNNAAYVHIGGSVYYPGIYVLTDYVCVRPAMWIDLS